ncbi:hypothetical protein I552_8413 [Mycobacterium xenopi 3993]|nr:hypothetical protein I552_8413 [Mycobacterium xenopi 3993]
MSSTVVDDAAQFARGLFLVLLPHVRRHLQLPRHLGVVVGLLFVAAPAVLEQFTPGLAQLAENRPSESRLSWIAPCAEGMVRKYSDTCSWCWAAVRKLSGTTWI